MENPDCWTCGTPHDVFIDCSREDLFREVRRLKKDGIPSVLQWTKKHPTVEGWYWMDDGVSKIIVNVFKRNGTFPPSFLDDDKCMVVLGRSMLSVEQMNNMWAGPIPFPI